MCIMKTPQGSPSAMTLKLQSFMSHLYDICHICVSPAVLFNVISYTDLFLKILEIP